MLAIAPFYKDWFSRGEGLGNFLSYGDYSSGNENDPKTFLFPRGVVLGRDLSVVHPVDPAKITEFVSHSWYEYSTGDANGKHPSVGETNPKYTGPKPPFDFLDVDKKYSWLKAPRYDGKPMEVGPLARMVVGYAAGKRTSAPRSMASLKKLNAPAGGAVLDARPPRGARSRIADSWPHNSKAGWISWRRTSITAMSRSSILSTGTRAHGPRKQRGFGWHEAPRGSLGHWIEIDGRSIKNYQAVVPTTWNAGPRDAQGQRGAYEASLAATPVADPSTAARDPAYDSFLRSVPRLRGTCHRCRGARILIAQGELRRIRCIPH